MTATHFGHFIRCISPELFGCATRHLRNSMDDDLIPFTCNREGVDHNFVTKALISTLMLLINLYKFQDKQYFYLETGLDRRSLPANQ